MLLKRYICFSLLLLSLSACLYLIFINVESIYMIFTIIMSFGIILYVLNINLQFKIKQWFVFYLLSIFNFVIFIAITLSLYLGFIISTLIASLLSSIILFTLMKKIFYIEFKINILKYLIFSVLITLSSFLFIFHIIQPQLIINILEMNLFISLTFWQLLNGIEVLRIFDDYRNNQIKFNN
jgi:hypothetical protein